MKDKLFLKSRVCEETAEQEVNASSFQNNVWVMEDKLFIRVPEVIENEFYDFISGILLDLIITKNTMDIVLLIDSYGGVLNATMDTYNLLSAMDNKIITVAFNKCCSAACLLFTLGSERYFLKDSLYILHQVRAIVSIEDQMQTSEIRKFANNFENSQNEYKKIIMKKTKIPKEKLNEIFNSLEDTKFKTEEIAKFGISTKVFRKFSELPF